MTGYAKILLNEVMPLVQKSYHVSANREERAIAGLSMGGAETLYTGLNNLDKFAWLGSFSGAFTLAPEQSDAAGAKSSPATQANREERALAGLSMGGAETLYTGLNNLDKFAWLGRFERRATESCGRVPQHRRVQRRPLRLHRRHRPFRRQRRQPVQRRAAGGEAAAAAAHRSMTLSSS